VNSDTANRTPKRRQHPAPSRLNQEALRQELAAAGVPYRLRFWTQVASTQDLVLRAAAAGEPEGLAVLAEAQVAGRGRQGRPWLSPPGSALLLSLLWRPRPSRWGWGTLPLVAGLAVAEGIETAGGPRVQLKWPNDCQVNGRKVAGILVETEGAEGGGEAAAVVGVGCNVFWAALPAAQNELPGATALDLEGGLVTLTGLAGAVLASLHRRYGEWQAGGFGPMLPDWTSRCVWLGQEVEVGLPQGRVGGRLEGLSEDGALLLETPDGRLLVPAGDVTGTEGPALRPQGGDHLGPSRSAAGT
jgi:BirA family biotin operon repressor/biotin-[acetyl-CoA-carboxylase] ligase